MSTESTHIWGYSGPLDIISVTIIVMIFPMIAKVTQIISHTRQNCPWLDYTQPLFHCELWGLVIRLAPRLGGPLGLAKAGRCRFLFGWISSYRNSSLSSLPSSISNWKIHDIKLWTYIAITALLFNVLFLVALSVCGGGIGTHDWLDLWEK